MKTYFGTDGSFGDAEDMLILDTTEWTSETWDKVADMTDSERYDFAYDIWFDKVNQDMEY